MDFSFSRTQIVFLMILTVGISNHVLIIPKLVQTAGRDAWVSIAIGYGVLIVWSVMLYRILKSMRQDSFSDWLKMKIGKFGYALIGGSMLLYFLIAGMMIIYDTTKNVSIYFLPSTPSIVVIACFMFIAFSAARTGLRTLIYLSALLLPIVWLLGMGVSWMTMNSKDYGILQPLMAEGLPAQLGGGTIVVGGSFDLIILLLLQHRMNKPLNYLTIFILLTILIGLILGPTIGSITAFGPIEASNLRFPAFEQWRLVTLGEYISHVDFLAAFQLLSGSVVRAGVCIYVLSEVVVIRKPKPRQIALFSGTLLMSLPALLQVSDIWMQKVIHDYFYNYALIWGMAVTLVLFALTYFTRMKAGRQS
ncbi:spore gernimation protein GerXB [Paenibacillus sp. 1011MAR3C5]|uniref:endospore germination permease n=1 Tax=Paenibacillus sp. 1011MAR3C5 TaxID=1675787 RepID=UPI000E6D2BF2|nr:endospore germination permease [Paenibacillus sp. 1011MAR3C5]RJE89715.1 spore gernimation protein GerXB [Paenibacillus sp. 1011MAR3C5]